MLLRIVYYYFLILLNVKFEALYSLVLQDGSVVGAETSEISYKMKL